MSSLTKCLDLFFKGISLLIGICFLIGGGNCFVLYIKDIFHSNIALFNDNFFSFVFMLLISLIPMFLGWFIIKGVFVKPKENNNYAQDDNNSNNQDKTHEP
ncbi:MAG: hypothetical protein WAX77_15955 [Methylococcaceae bacterium]